ncbi:MAG: pyruvate, phosphate dikinase, partial [Chloroflexi bacterium]
AVLDAVKKCWASLWTARAIAYRLKNNIDQKTVALAVVVQRLIAADAAGILFTANPINGKRSELVINAAWGLGEAVVSGAVTPDTIVVDKGTGKIIRRETAEKQVMTVRTEGGVIEQPVPEVQKRKPALTDLQTEELANLGIKIEQFYDMPMDIEWALAGGEFAIVQARPITAMPEPPVEWIRPDPKAIYARGSLAEHTPSPVTPLFATLGLDIANDATNRMWNEIVGKGSAELLPNHGGMYIPLNGYVFGGVRMQPKDMLVILKMSFSQLPFIFRNSNERWRTARQDFAAVVEEWEQKDISSLTPSELLDGVQIVFGAACKYFTKIQTTLPAASSSETLFTRLYKSLIKRQTDPDASTFLLGFDTAALRAEKSLYDLAMWIKEHPNLAVYILDTPTENVIHIIGDGMAPDSVPGDLWDDLKKRFQRHLEEFGRTTYEFDFANPTPAESPGPLMDAIKAFLAGKAQNPEERQQEAIAKREKATTEVLKRVGWPRRSWFEKLLRWAQSTGPVREDSIYDMGMGHPLVRQMLNELGSRFTKGGAIDQAGDIYWLERKEVEKLVTSLGSSQPLPDMSGSIPARKAQWQANFKASPPVMLPERSGWSKLIHGSEAETKDGRVILKGVGTSSGVVTAPARVLLSPEDFSQMKPGDVLVAVTTTPAWTPLFALASAVVTDIGGPLSHSSIVAREYGIPAVMAARGATRAIQNGEMITVDGSKGIVTLEI